MAEAATCPDCGAALPADAPQGFCPQCLMAAGVTPASQTGETLGGEVAPEFLLPLGELDGEDTLPTRFGDYQLLEEIAHGGMGVVYKARQRSLNRIVAVKMILAGQFATKEFVRRFRAEAATAAVLQHPNIVAIHEVGIHDGRHFFSMDYVEGQNLAQLVGHRPLPPLQAARYLKIMAEAVQYAHEQGILHRDLKPSNVLIDSATDQPRVTDFGLARRLDGESSLTVTGQIVGSPNFMPPEQAGEGHGKLGRHSDVYGLGAILYYLLTARPPFQAESLSATVTQVINAEPVAPRLLNASVRSDLETICLKCLEKEPARRYQTAKELAEELGRFLNGEPIVARPLSRPERAWRWCRRKPALATIGTIALALLLVVVFGAPIAIVRIQRARAEAERDLYAADMKLVSEAVKNGAYSYARELLEKHRPNRGQTDLRGFEWRYFLKVLKDHEPVRTLAGLAAPSGWEDGSLTVRRNILYNESGTELRAWDMTTWESMRLTKPPQPSWVEWVWYPETDRAYTVDNSNAMLRVYRLPKFEKGPTFNLAGPVSETALSRDGEMLAAAVRSGDKQRVVVWNLDRAVQIAEFGQYDADISRLVFSPDKTIFGVNCADGTLSLWDTATLKAIPTPPNNGHPRHIEFIKFLPDSKRLFFCENYGIRAMRMWDVRTAAESVCAPGGVGQIYLFGFSPDGNYLVTDDNRQDLNLLDARTLQIVATLRGHHGLVRGTGYSPDGKLLATASVDQTARVWDLATHQEVATLGGFGERISDVKFSADGQSILLLSGFGTLKVYDRSKVLNRGLFAMEHDDGGVFDVVLSPDQRILATRTAMGTVTLWDRTSRTQLQSLTFEDGYTLGSLAFAPGGESLAWASHKALRILSPQSGKISSIPMNGNQDRGDVAFSPDGRELAYGCRTQLMVLELKSQRQRPFISTDDEVFALSYSPDGKLLAFGDRLGSVTMCDRTSGHILFKTNAHPPTVYGVEFSPNGRLLATSGGDASIKLWAIHSHGLTLIATLRGHLGYVMGLAFSPDGMRLVSASGDQTLKLWDVAQGVEVATLYGHTDYVRGVRFTQDGNTIYSTGFGNDKAVRFWTAARLDRVETQGPPE